MPRIIAVRAPGCSRVTRRLPLWLGWLLAILVAAGFALLGRWQLQRMHAKQAMLDAQGPAAAQALPLAQALAAPGALHGVADHGRFLPGVVLLDNQMRHGRAGDRAQEQRTQASVRDNPGLLFSKE